MKAVVLAGGFGTRLGDLTKDIPKPLIKIGEKSVLEHIVDRLNDHGVTEIIVKIHYLPDQIIKQLGDRVLYYFEPALFDWKETLSRLRFWLKDEDFLLINGDTINDLNYTEMIDFHEPQTITAAMDDWRAVGTWIYTRDFFDVDLNKNLPIIPYRSKDLNWFDIGTPSRLEAAKKHFEEGKIII
jgi:NDP-sugar pyrophosphorylase family protein